VGGVDELVARYGRALTVYTARITRDPERARDIMQDTFLRFHRIQPAGGESDLRAWLYTVCRNLALDQLRKDRPMHVVEASPDLPDTRPSASEALEASEAKTSMMRFLAALPEPQQEVIRLKFQGSLSYKEISGVTKLSVSHVGVLIHQGIKALRAQMAEEGGAR